MTAEREKELLGLILAYWKMRGHPCFIVPYRPGEAYQHATAAHVSVDHPERRTFYGTEPHPMIYFDSWAESEACLREVAGECAVRGYSIDFNIGECDFVLESPECVGFCAEPGEKRSAALLKAFVAAFSKEPA